MSGMLSVCTIVVGVMLMACRSDTQAGLYYFRDEYHPTQQPQTIPVIACMDLIAAATSTKCAIDIKMQIY